MNKCLLNLKLPMDSQVVGGSKDWTFWKNLIFFGNFSHMVGPIVSQTCSTLKEKSEFASDISHMLT